MLVLQFALRTVIEAGPAAVDRPQMQTDTSETDHHDALRILVHLELRCAHWDTAMSAQLAEHCIHVPTQDRMHQKGREVTVCDVTV